MHKFNATSALKEKFSVMSVIVNMIDSFESEVENLSKATSKHEFVTRRVACETRYCVIVETINKTNTNLSIFEQTLSAIMDNFEEISDEKTAVFSDKPSE